MLDTASILVFILSLDLYGDLYFSKSTLSLYAKNCFHSLTAKVRTISSIALQCDTYKIIYKSISINILLKNLIYVYIYLKQSK